MSIRIEINNQYVITSDRYQFILQEKKTATSGKNEGKEWLDVVGYYPTISKLVSGLVLHLPISRQKESPRCKARNKTNTD